MIGASDLAEKLELFDVPVIEWLQNVRIASIEQFTQWVTTHFLAGNVVEWAVTATTSFALIAAAEIGDKSQVVCMTLAARHRSAPVLLGAASAFAVLNLMAVVFGVAVATWIPKHIVAVIVAVLFASFGIHALLVKGEDEDGELSQSSGHSIFISSFLLIIVAEFGDKTQLAVAALSCCAIPASVWLGATLALCMTSAIGVWVGRTVLQRIPIVLLHRISGTIFLFLAGFAVYLAVSG